MFAGIFPAITHRTRRGFLVIVYRLRRLLANARGRSRRPEPVGRRHAVRTGMRGAPGFPGSPMQPAFDAMTATPSLLQRLPAGAGVSPMSATASTFSRSRRKSLSFTLAATLSAVVHGLLWSLWQTTEREPEQPPPPLIIEATMVTTPPPVEPQPPAPAKPPEPTPPKPEPKPPEKPKPAPKPKPKPVAKPEPVQEPRTNVEPAPAAPAVSQAPPAPAPVAPAAPPTPAIFNAASLNNPKTSYPPVAQQRGWEGKVLLQVRVQANGTAGQISVQQSSGHEMLDESAIEQVRHWHFIPATRDGKPIESSVVVPVEFKISKR